MPKDTRVVRHATNHSKSKGPRKLGVTRGVMKSAYTFAGDSPNRDMTPEEWQLRVQIAACCRIFAHLGWTEVGCSHLTVRSSDPTLGILTTPSDFAFKEVTASSVERIQIERPDAGNAGRRVNPERFALHLALHQGIPDARCVMHTHMAAGMAVACSREELSLTNFFAARLRDKIAYYDFDDGASYAEQMADLLQGIRNRQAVVLRKYGLLAWADDVPSCFQVLWTVSRACEIQVSSAALGSQTEAAQRVADERLEHGRGIDLSGGCGSDAFAVLRRTVDLIDPSYAF
jgi:ribulose-5-phosphate 4-epimerase/fuculose-1-phosphate aldolase